MTKGQLLSILYERLNLASSPGSDVTTRLGNHLNQAHRMILRQPGLEGLRDAVNSTLFSSVANLQTYGLPPVLANIRGITDTTNDRKLVPMSVAEWRLRDPDISTTGTPYAYVYLGLRACKRLPQGTGLWAVSSSASDTTPVIQVNGTRADGIMTGDQTATLTGQTRVAIGAPFTDWLDITTISLSIAAVGIVSIYDASTSGNVLAQIPIGHTYPHYLGINLYPIPSAVISYSVDGDGRILDMDDTVDVPQLPEDFHDLLIPAALMLEYEKTDDPRYVLASRRYDEGLSALKYWVTANGDVLPNLAHPRRIQHSRLGSEYPADY